MSVEGALDDGVSCAVTAWIEWSKATSGALSRRFIAW